MKRFLSLLLCCALALCAAGCGEAPAPAQATGRYVEHEITPKGLSAGEARGLFQLADGALCYLGGMLDFFISIDGGDSWQRQDTGWYEALAQMAGTQAITLGVTREGAVWAAAPSEDGFALFCVEDGAPRRTADVAAGEELHPVQLQWDGEGRLFVMAFPDEGDALLLQVDADGGVERRFAVDYGVNFEVADGRAELFTYEGEQITYDLAAGRETARRTLSGEAVGALAPDGAAWAVSADGIFCVTAGGSVAEALFAGTGNRFQAPGYSPRAVLPLQNGSLCVAYDSARGAAVCRYDYDPDALVRGENALVVWALHGGLTLNAAVTAFKEAHPEVDVVLELGHTSEDDGLDDAEIIRTLNTALLAGDAPDLLILDGLPADSLIRKGMLEDLSGLVDGTEYFENLFSAWTREGKTYAYPAKVLLPVLLAQPDDPPAGGSLAALAEEAAAGKALPPSGEATGLAAADQPLFYFDDWRTLFDMFYACAAPELFCEDGCDETVLREFLTATRAVSDRYGLTAEPSGRVSGAVGNDESGKSYYYPVQVDAFAYGAARRCAVLLDELSNLQSAFWFKETAVSLMPGGAYLPRVSAAVPVNAPQKELAKEFIRILLSQPVQAARNYFEGLPVRREALAAQQENMREGIRDWQEKFPQYNYAEGLAFNAASLLSAASAPVPSNEQLKETIYEQATKFYDKSRTLDETVAEITKATSLYFEEQRQ